ncbi:hypothetical protein SAY87_003215 [Trapa incisa]|uniref:Exocyst subunit Exo70 family protein n=1 Tax=Trapa incisa TaxID=236973 RepID=A0AAN7KN55_9MYRT|nr:hypothetical protein SAY87_003215 [Trapa incisa]
MATSGGSGAADGGGRGDDRVLATAQQILKSLNTPKEVRDDMLLIFSSFDNRLSNITDLVKDGDPEERFQSAEQIIQRWDSDAGASRRTLAWEDSPDEAAQYLSAIDEILRLYENLSLEDDKDRDLIERADSAIQLAMSLLEDEFRHILIRNTVPLDAERMYGSIRRVSLSFAANEGEIDDELESFGEVDNDSSGCFHERGPSLGDDLCFDLINPDAVAELREIVERMVRSGYEKECIQAYTSVRREALDECLVILGAEKLSIEEVQKMGWPDLNETMKKWIQAVKIAVRVLLSGEKKLCDQIFDEAEWMKEACFKDTAKGCLIQLLNFGEAVAIGVRSSEKLFRILDMYDALAGVMPDLQAMIMDDFVRIEAKGVLDALGDAARGTFEEFEKAVQNETSRRPMQGGEIHPLTRYVMNYIKLLADYSDTLNLLLGSSEDELQNLQHKDDKLQIENMPPISQRLLLLLSCLESNLEEKSRLYEDPGMQYVFLMNNIWYMVQKVKDSELAKLLGDHWVRKRRGQVRQYARNYLRTSWTKALSCLKDEGIGGSSSNASRVALKERFKSFNACFEDIYRIQTAWKVPDTQLQDELRISISEMVIPAYRSFLGRFRNQLESGRDSGKYIKYTPEDLENYVSDLFVGVPNVLHNLRRKSS